MIKKLVLFFCLIILPVNAYADNCLSLIKQIDNLLSETKQLSKDQLSEIKQLRAQGEQAHKSGDHKESEEMLKQALDLLDG